MSSDDILTLREIFADKGKLKDTFAYGYIITAQRLLDSEENVSGNFLKIFWVKKHKMLAERPKIITIANKKSSNSIALTRAYSMLSERPRYLK